MIVKKSQRGEVAFNAIKQPIERRFGKKASLHVAETVKEVAAPESAEVSLLAPDTKVRRLCTEIDEQTYMKLKWYSMNNRVSIVSILSKLINTHCTSNTPV